MDPKQEKIQLRKLQRQHRKELRGAAKELRKDSAALGRRRLEEWKAMRARDDSNKNQVRIVVCQLYSEAVSDKRAVQIMSFIEAQASQYGRGKKKRHKSGS